MSETKKEKEVKKVKISKPKKIEDTTWLDPEAEIVIKKGE
jgi:hypothetical protein